MNEDKAHQPWFEKDPRLFQEQETILKSAGFELNQEILKQHRQVQFIGLSKADPGRQLLIEFPESFPSAAPKIRDTVASKLFPRHHRGDTRQFCLFGFNEQRWNAELSVADALKEVENLISELKAGKLDLQDEAPEPLTRSISFTPESAILIPPPISTFEGFSELKHSTGKFSGKFCNELSDKKGTRGRGIIFEANFGDKKIACSPQYTGFFANQGKDFQGDWFFLKEPLTHENFKDILTKCLQQVKAFKKAEIYWIGLVFREEIARADQSRLTWLIVRAHAKAPEIHLLRAFPYVDQERFARIPGLEGLEKKRVAIVGCGSLGSKIAANLAATGVSSFRLFDFDYYEPNNAVRHELVVECFGFNKERVLLNRLCSLNPAVAADSKSLNFQVGSISPFAIEQQFRSFMAESDIIVDATGLHSAGHYLNRLSFELRRPAMFVSVTNGAWGGEVVRTIPGKTPCWVCWLFQYFENPPPSAPRSVAEVFPPGCDQPTFTGTAYDLGMVANMAASMAVETLLAADKETDLSKNYIRWSGRDTNGKLIYQTEMLPINYRQECPYCRS